MTPALVIGGASFLGRHLCHRLRHDRAPFTAASRSGRDALLRCDITRSQEIDAALKAVRPAVIYHCAGLTSTATEDELFRVHRDGADNLLQSVAQHVPGALVILMGSAAEYGPVAAERLPIREDTPAAPQSPYGRSKLAQTETAQRLASELGLRVVIARPFNILGPGLGPQYFAAAFAEKLRRLQKEGRSGVVPVANGRATRDWIHVGDVVDALCGLGEIRTLRGAAEVFNIATGTETTVLDLANAFCRRAGVFEAVDEGVAASRSGIDRSAGDSSRLRHATGWRPTRTWQEAVADMWHV
ncbi:MAG: NAD(P)-dependent oxidoreductase [Gemmataceae bacterium]